MGYRQKNKLQRLARELHSFVDAQYDCWNQQLLPALRREGIRILSVAHLDRAGRDAMDLFFTRQVDPILTPVTIDPSHPFPHVLNKALCVAFHLRRNSKPGTTYLGVVTVPRKLPASGSRSGQEREHRLHIPARPDRNPYPQPVQGLQGPLLCRISRHPQQQPLSARGRVPQSARTCGQSTAQPPQGRRGDGWKSKRVRRRRSSIRLARQFALRPWQVFKTKGPVNLSRLFSLAEQTPRPDLKFPPFTSRSLSFAPKVSNLLEVNSPAGHSASSSLRFLRAGCFLSSRPRHAIRRCYRSSRRFTGRTKTLPSCAPSWKQPRPRK